MHTASNQWAWAIHSNLSWYNMNSVFLQCPLNKMQSANGSTMGYELKIWTLWIKKVFTEHTR